jgi:hypothetical protein
VSDPGGKQHDAADDDPVWKLGDGVLVQDRLPAAVFDVVDDVEFPAGSDFVQVDAAEHRNE